MIIIAKILWYALTAGSDSSSSSPSHFPFPTGFFAAGGAGAAFGAAAGFPTEDSSLPDSSTRHERKFVRYLVGVTNIKARDSTPIRHVSCLMIF